MKYFVYVFVIIISGILEYLGISMIDKQKIPNVIIIIFTICIVAVEILLLSKLFFLAEA